MYPDYEINHKDDDLLNRNEFAIRLADNIIQYKPKKTLTIGIIGSWGSGKSSLINLTENILKKEEVIIIRFNPWFFSSQDNLYLQFFKQIISTLRYEENNKNIFERKIKPKRNLFKKQDDSLKNYFNYLKDSTSYFTIDNLKHDSNFESYDSLDYHKEKCKNYIKTFDCKIIVIIDDIDRLTNTEIAQIFTLVKSLADFENFIYILSFDKTIVTKALNDVNSEHNDNFIDKIIQIPISVPQISSSKMDELILKEIGEIYDTTSSKINIKNDFGEIFDYLKLFIKDMRDLKRYKNTLEFYLNNFLEDLNINDFFLILAIHLFEYELFLNINRNEDSLILRKDQFNNYMQASIFTKYEEFEIIFKGDKWNYLREVLIFLFPKLTSTPKEIKYETYENWENTHRICSEKYFEKYFTLSLENNEISQKSLNQLIKLNEVDEIFEFFTKEKNLNYNHSLLIGFKQLIPKIPQKNCEFFIKALMKAGDSMEIYPHSRRYFNWIFDDLFNKIESADERYRILKECIEFYDDNVFTATEYTYSLAEYYDLVGYSKNIKSENEMIIGKSEVEDFITFIIHRIHKDCSNETFLNQKYLPAMLNYWEEFEDKETVKKYVLENITTPGEILSFLNKFQNEETPETELLFDFEKLNTYHGLKIYENNITEILDNDNTHDKTKEFCELFLGQLKKYKLEPHPLFITHSKKYQEPYNTIENWINDSDINWRNMSRIHPDSENQNSDKELENLLENNIQNSSLVIFIIEMYELEKDIFWIKKEMEMAQKYNKPILATNHWRLETLPSNVKNIPDKYVHWQKTDVIIGIKEILGID